ncbi:MAG: 8-amino-7-oxononanoate synthase [Novosphingobium sp.]
MPVFAAQRSDLARLADQGRYRALRPRAGVDFASNDYLGLAGCARLRDAAAEALAAGVPLGSGGSRLLRGNCDDHEALEADAAAYFRSESAVYFSSGFAANTTLFATLPQRTDLVVHDSLIHASARDGIRLGRAQASEAAHNDPDSFEAAIRAWRGARGTGTPWIAVESLYSMDGDRAPLADLAAVADRHDAVLVIDEAHATGVFGARGEGLAGALAGRANVIALHTCGKALGCEGALLCGPRVMREAIVNRGRGFIFSTAPSPLMARVVREALRILADEPERRTRLWDLVRLAESALAPLGVVCSGSPILPLIVGDEVRTMARAEAIQRAGFDVRGIRPPTVPAGTSRLRISLTLNATADDVRGLAAVLGDCP